MRPSRAHTLLIRLSAAAAAALGGTLLLALVFAATAAADLHYTVKVIKPATSHSQDLGSLQAEAARVRAKVARLDAQAQIAIEKYDIARADLDAINTRLMLARADLQRTQAQLDEAETALGERMAQMYKSDGVTLLDVLLTADDFSEVSTQIGYCRAYNEADQEAVARVEQLTRDTERLTAQIDSERAIAVTKQTDLLDKRTDVEDELAQRQAVLNQLDGRIKKIVDQQAHLAAAESRRLARSAGVDVGTIVGTRVQLAVVRETMRYLGIPYVWAGATPSGGFDCSGLVMYVFAKFHVDLPHAATYQARAGHPVPLDQLEPADLVFFGYPAFYHHVGIYIGNGLFIEAPCTGEVVKVSRLAGRGCALACRYPLRMP